MLIIMRSLLWTGGVPAFTPLPAQTGTSEVHRAVTGTSAVDREASGTSRVRRTVTGESFLERVD
jgi:hypothetical protein